MKRYEKESLIKNFLVFFLLLETLLILLFIQLYRTQLREYKQSQLKSMNVCNYTMKCKQFHYDFVPQDRKKLNTLFEEDGLSSYYNILDSKKYFMRISYPQKNYLGDISHLRNILWIKFILASLLLLALALFFTFYSLRPIRKALLLNDEFIKDILHDFNTPISSMILNIKMFQEDYANEPLIERISQSIHHIMQLQNNLKSFLQRSPSQNTQVKISKILEERITIMQQSYPKIHFSFVKENALTALTNEDMLIRIFDNILSNAAKYNKPKGSVDILLLGTHIIIKDTGKGIENIHKVTQRYYKEQERGLGLGLHIVQKLVEELNITMHIQSKVHQGSTFTLDFSSVDEVKYETK